VNNATPEPNNQPRRREPHDVPDVRADAITEALNRLTTQGVQTVTARHALHSIMTELYDLRGQSHARDD
jgi:hypothetical protein